MSLSNKNSAIINISDLNNINDHLPIGIYRTSLDGKFLYANKTLADMLEYDVEEILNIPVNKLFFNSIERDSEIDLMLKNEEGEACNEVSLKTKTGKSIIVKDTFQAVKNDNGNILHFDGILEEISGSESKNQEIRKSRIGYKMLTDLTIEGIVIHDKGIIVETNSSLQLKTGYSAEYLKGKGIYEFIHPDSKEQVVDNLKTKFNGIFELKIICKDKSTLITEAESRDVVINNKEYRVVAVRDITDRVNIEKENLALSTAVKQSPTSIVITDPNGLIEYVNPKFTEVTGYTYEEAIGKNPSILKTDHTVSEDYREMWETIASGKTWRGEFLNKRKDGKHYWELASISPIIDSNGRIISYLAVKEDITERKVTLNALIESEKKLLQADATKNMFFSIIAHDLKGPVGNIIQLLDLLKQDFHDISNEERLDYLNILTTITSKTNILLEDLLLWARIQMNTLEFDITNTNIKPLVDFSKNIVIEKAIAKNIEILLDIEDIKVHVNESSVNTVIRNLFSNAIKFSHRDSQILVNSIVSSKENIIEISIEDKGLGIPKESIDNLFKIETTFSTYGTDNEKGTGLGLIICKELIEKNDGSIRVESKENVGSTFYITLPLSK